MSARCSWKWCRRSCWRWRRRLNASSRCWGRSVTYSVLPSRPYALHRYSASFLAAVLMNKAGVTACVERRRGYWGGITMEGEGLLGWDYRGGEGLLGWDYFGGGGVTGVGLLWRGRGYWGGITVEEEGLLGWDYCRERDFFGGGGVIVEIIRLHGEGEELLGWDYCGEGGVTEVGLLWRGYCGDYVTEGREGATVKREGLLWRGRGLLWRGRGYCGDF